VRGAYGVKVNSLVGFDIDPAAIRKTATGKSNRMRPFTVDNRELQIALEWCGIYQLPIHDPTTITNHPNRRL
jgi:hypothetical protein